MYATHATGLHRRVQLWKSRNDLCPGVFLRVLQPASSLDPGVYREQLWLAYQLESARHQQYQHHLYVLPGKSCASHDSNNQRHDSVEECWRIHMCFFFYSLKYILPDKALWYNGRISHGRVSFNWKSEEESFGSCNWRISLFNCLHKHMFIPQNLKSRFGLTTIKTSHITGPLWGESTGHRWIPLTKGQ